MVSAVQNVSRVLQKEQQFAANSPGSLRKGPGLFLRYFMERARNAAIWALVQAPVGSK